MARGKNGTINLSREIRRIAREILETPGNYMLFTKLQEKIEQKLGRPLRSDNLNHALTTQNSGMEIIRGVVILKRQFPLHQSSTPKKKVAKKKTAKKKATKKTSRKKVAKKKTTKKTTTRKTATKKKAAKKSIKKTRRRGTMKPDHKLNVEEFTLLAIKKLRKRPKDKGIHAVYSGFNEAFRKYFPGRDPVEEMKALAARDVINIRPVQGGVMIFPGPAPEGTVTNDAGGDALQKMGLLE